MSPSSPSGSYTRRYTVEELVEKRLRSSWGRLTTPVPAVASEMHDMIFQVQPDRWQEIAERCKTHPHEAARLDCRGRTCLHVACTKNPPEHVVMALIRAVSLRRREAVLLERDKHGSTALSIAVASGCSLQVVSRLLLHSGASSRAASISDHNGHVPLHIACKGYTHDRRDVVVKLLECYPDAARRECNYGRTPVHEAIDCKAPVDLVKLLIQASPEVVIMNGCGLNPLFLAIRSRAPPEVIIALVNANPAATLMRDRRHGLPLRRAVERNLPLHVLSALISSPDVVLDGESDTKHTILHTLLECGYPREEVLRLLVEAAPQVAVCRGRNGQSPLAMAFQRYLRMERRSQSFWGIVEILLKAAKYNRLHDNDHVVHAAAGLDVPWEVAVSAMALYPEQISEIDEFGDYPLHLALTSPTHDKKTDKISILLRHYPEAACVRTRDGLSTLDIAARSSGIESQVLTDLILANPDALKVVSPVDGLYPFEAASLPKDESSHDDTDSRRAQEEIVQVSAIFTFLTAAPDLVLQRT